MRLLRSKYIIIVFILLKCCQSKANEFDSVQLTNLKAGIAKVDITPPIGIPLGGYADRKGSATGIHDLLHTVVIVFDDGVNKAALITLDVLHITQAIGDSMRNAITAVTGVSTEYILINASHTHGSPWLDSDSHYQQQVIAKVAGAARMAIAKLKPVSIGYGEGKIDFNVSRRFIDKDGKCTGRLNPDGLCDHRVKILRIDDGEALTPIAVLIHAVCHANVYRAANTEVTGDYPALAKAFVERAFHHQTTALFLQGCAGDIRPNLPDVGSNENGYGRSGSEADMTWCAWSLGAETVKIATKLRVYEELQRRKNFYTISAAHDFVFLDSDQEKSTGLIWPRERLIDDKYRLPIHVIKIGDIWFIGLPGEPVVEYGLQIENQLKGQGKVFVLGYCAGDAGYIPVAHMFAEGGYEAQCPFTPECEQEILTGVTHLIQAVLNKEEKNHE